MIYDKNGKAMTADKKTQEILDNESIPFSLECVGCDSGMDVHSFDEAIAIGWRDIEYENGPGWNYLGHCPECINIEIGQPELFI